MAPTELPIANLVAIILGGLIFLTGSLLGWDWRVTVPVGAILMLSVYHGIKFFRRR